MAAKRRLSDSSPKGGDDHAVRRNEEGQGQAKAQAPRQGHAQAKGQGDARVVAVDCDLRQSYAASWDGRTARGDTPLAVLSVLDVDPTTTTVLYEIAEPASFLRSAPSTGVGYQLAKWAIWNVAHAVLVSVAYPLTLVSPSSAWTLGYTKAQRHAIAKATATKADERDCQAMLVFFHRNPTLWVPVSEFLASLRR